MARLRRFVAESAWTPTIPKRSAMVALWTRVKWEDSVLVLFAEPLRDLELRRPITRADIPRKRVEASVPLPSKERNAVAVDH